jgi:hypothetical protein
MFLNRYGSKLLQTLHPKPEALRVACPSRNWTRASLVGGELSSKELFKHRILLIALWNICWWGREMAPHSVCGYMHIHDHKWDALGCRPNSTCKTYNPEYCH